MDVRFRTVPLTTTGCGCFLVPRLPFDVGCLQLCQLSRDGEAYHDYCLNYSKAMSYLEQLRKKEDFCEFEKVMQQSTLSSHDRNSSGVILRQISCI